MFRFVPSASMKVELLPGQEKWLSTPEKIAKQAQRPDVEAFAIYRGEELVGFALLRRNEDGSWFLWDYAMGRDYQGQGLGEAALRELIALFQREKGMKKLVTTYIWGNDQAKHLYEKVGFRQFQVWDEPGCHEVDMEYLITEGPGSEKDAAVLGACGDCARRDKD